ncbi:hypothetical protein [Flavobacterium urocaniciphilum]|uniref:Uncharacterized protein n=1 Tax=Flavobacterium urocaniciphilum TaxID=1299341 RepID=A0A1H9DZ64_9FLAO|nr:hypothetical protein [Flavobacterium urocaniciphilum]SEQ18745.1 hypothetical protein SAMN05444005_1093 [Flavobacterium urocaniciphilum]
MKNFLLTFFILFCINTFSQTKSSTPVEINETQKKLPAKGTYQFIINDTKNQYAFSEETLLLIESQRKENENVKLELGKNVQVIILSRKYISSKEFKPVDEFNYNL